MIWSTSLSGFNLRPWPSCPGCPPDFRPVGSFAARGFACGGSDDGGLEEFRDGCLSRASSCATRCSNSMTTTRTATGVALQSSSLIPSGGNGFDMLARCLSLNRRCYNLTLPICAVTYLLLGFFPCERFSSPAFLTHSLLVPSG